ncbi:MAG: four helix bundle protein [Ruminococcaceae bacterium]|nr:four helix bundle protein [Oscillospiraceae bacterium]
MLRIGDIHAFGVIGMRDCGKLLNYLAKYDIIFFEGSDCMAKNCLLIYSEQLATDIELLCHNIKAPSNTLFQIRKSSSSVYANIREANYGQSKADMLSKFEIALKECSETEGWLQLLFNTNGIDEETYKNYRNLCGRIRRMLIASCKTLKESIK